MEGKRKVSRFLAPPPQAASGSSTNIIFRGRTENGNDCEKLGTNTLLGSNFYFSFSVFQ